MKKSEVKIKMLEKTDILICLKIDFFYYFMFLLHLYFNYILFLLHFIKLLKKIG